MPTGYIQNAQAITGHIIQNGMKGILKDSARISGTVNKIQQFSGTIKSPSHIHGIISKPSNEHAKSDHVFVIVDLLKIHEQRLTVNSINAVVPFTATNTQSESSQLNINFVSETITVNEEVYSNADT